MNTLEIAIIASMFALPAAAVIIIAVCSYYDIQSKKEMRHFEAAMRQCSDSRGWTFTKNLLENCSNSMLPVKNRIELLEYFASVTN